MILSIAFLLFVLGIAIFAIKLSKHDSNIVESQIAVARLQREINKQLTKGNK
jgi:hypothetical protein